MLIILSYLLSKTYIEAKAGKYARGVARNSNEDDDILLRPDTCLLVSLNGYFQPVGEEDRPLTLEKQVFPTVSDYEEKQRAIIDVCFFLLLLIFNMLLNFFWICIYVYFV